MAKRDEIDDSEDRFADYRASKEYRDLMNGFDEDTWVDGLVFVGAGVIGCLIVAGLIIFVSDWLEVLK